MNYYIIFKPEVNSVTLVLFAIECLLFLQLCIEFVLENL
jgi:hypothetical protein